MPVVSAHCRSRLVLHVPAELTNSEPARCGQWLDVCGCGTCSTKRGWDIGEHELDRTEGICH